MKQLMLSKQKASYLFDHVLDGFSSSDAGIKQLKEKQLIGHDEYVELLEKNTERLIARINAFKIGQQVMAIFFAFLLGYLQINGDDLEMRRTTRVRTSSSRSVRARTGKKKQPLTT